ncbi:hypothetical protein D9756_009893 [Leucocoprinus leucothites]|uniref:Glycan binding protein Y3-like domain-containing protein n=1 Tax=Leucocoprinus leucothites TaxID=201217 RepID=A0A8H5CSW7_9AGAR|nr:hypothetical protein D9756_009893 [Leucoagaricus leucothites]
MQVCQLSYINQSPGRVLDLGLRTLTFATTHFSLSTFYSSLHTFIMFKAVVLACVLASVWAQSPDCSLMTHGLGASDCSDGISKYCAAPGTESVNAGNEKWFCRRGSNGQMCKIGGKNMNDPNSASGTGASFPPPQDKCGPSFDQIRNSCNTDGGKVQLDSPSFSFMVETNVASPNTICDDPRNQLQ